MEGSVKLLKCVKLQADINVILTIVLILKT